MRQILQKNKFRLPKTTNGRRICQQSKIKKENHTVILLIWLRGHDSNVRPPGYEPDELPTALPRGAKIQLFCYEASNWGFYFLVEN